jgi:hypothetical protein
MQSIKKKNIKTYVFVVVTVVSVLLLWAPTSNYVQFYKATSEIKVSALRSTLTFVPDLDCRVLVSINVTAENPTGYSGIGVVSVMFNLFFNKTGDPRDLSHGNRVWFKEEPGESLDPHSNVTKSYDLVLDLRKMKEIYEELNTLQQAGQEMDLFLGGINVDIHFFLGRIFIPVEDTPLNTL